MFSYNFGSRNSHPGGKPQFSVVMWISFFIVKSHFELFSSKVNKISIRAKWLFSKFQFIYKWPQIARELLGGIPKVVSYNRICTGSLRGNLYAHILFNKVDGRLLVSKLTFDVLTWKKKVNYPSASLEVFLFC